MPFADYLIQPSEMNLSPEAIDRKRKLAQMLMAQGSDYSPVDSWTQGAARMAQALAGGLQELRLDKQEAAGRASASKAFADAMSGMMGGGATGGVAGALANPEGSTGGYNPAGKMPTFAKVDLPVSWKDLKPEQAGLLNAIAAPESGGAYNVRYTPRGGAAFADYGQHPGIAEQGPAGPSTAAGRYQITKTTWNSLPGFAQGDFSPANQDKAALALARRDYQARTGRDLDADLDAHGMTPQIASALAPTWHGLSANLQKAMAAYQSTIQKYGSAGGQPAPATAAAAPPQTAPAAPSAPQADIPAPGARPVSYDIPGTGGAEASGQSHGVSPQAVMQAASSPQVQAAAQQHAQTPQGQALVQQASAAPMAALMSAMANPWMSDGQRAVLMMVAKQKMEQMNPQYGFQTTPDGTILRTNPRDGTVTPIYQAQPKPMAVGNDQRLVDPSTGREIVGAGETRPMTADERKAFQVPDGVPAAMENGKPKFGQPGMSVSLSADKKGSELMAQKGVEMFDKAQSAASSANRRIAMYGQMLNAAQSFQPGASAEMRLAAKKWLKEAGVISGEDVPDGEAMKAVQRRLELAATPSGQGQITENERFLIRDTIPTLANTPGGMQRIISNLKKLDDYDIKVAQIVRDNARRNGGVPDYLSVSDEIAQLGPPLDDNERAALLSLKEGGAQGAIPDTGPNGQPTNLKSPVTDTLQKAPPVAMPKVGEVRKNYQFLGGDPSKPESWRKVQ